MTKTTQIYNQHSSEFIARYDNAQMSHLHALLLKYLKPKASVLDIGFGSGRDLQFLYDNGYDIWGMDPSHKFVKNAIERFSAHKNHFFLANLPLEKKELGFNVAFEGIISIAMWMHLNRSEYADAVENIVSIATTDATLIISYSEGNRAQDERYFEEVDLSYLLELFEAQSYCLVEKIENRDSLNRDTLTWITVVLQNNSQKKLAV